MTPRRSSSTPTTDDVPGRRLLLPDQGAPKWPTQDRPSRTPSAASASTSCRTSRGHGRRAARVRARADARRARPRRARAPRAGGALPRARGHDEVPARHAHDRRRGLGDTVEVPAGRVHKFTNAGDGPARARVETSPAPDMEDLFTTTAELAHEGNVTRTGMPLAPCTWRCSSERYRREVRAPFPPAWVVWCVLMAPLRRHGPPPWPRRSLRARRRPRAAAARCLSASATARWSFVCAYRTQTTSDPK